MDYEPEAPAPADDAMAEPTPAMAIESEEAAPADARGR